MPRNDWNEEFPPLGDCDWKRSGVPTGTMTTEGNNTEDMEKGPEEEDADLAGKI